jgi:uncharacterized protein YvpB
VCPEVVKEDPKAIFARSARRPDLERRYRRRPIIAAILVVAAVLAAAAAIIVGAGDDQSKRVGRNAAAGPVVLRGSEGAKLATLSAAEVSRLEAGRAPLPLELARVVEDGSSSVTYRLDRAALRERLAGAGGSVTVPERAVASRISTPVVQQRFQNNCETAALSMLLASQGVERDQAKLQEEVAHDGPLDPRTGPGGEMVWGDPERGFVGRVEGGGTAGGYGVYEQPILDLARRYVEPVDLSGKGPGAVYEKLLEGRPVFTWIGLQDGPYETWTSPAGEEVTANYGEHTVLLVGIEDDRVLVNDPLDGTRKWWTKSQFEQMFERLDSRAISVT